MAIKIRKCSQCGENSLQKEGAIFAFYGYEEKYCCTNCGFKTSITPGAAQGTYSAIYLLGMVIFYYLFMGGMRQTRWDVSDYIIFIIVGLLGLWPLLRDYFANKEHPIIIESEDEGNKKKEPFIHRLMSSGNFLQGFFSPIIFIALFLGFFLVLGLINYHFFDDQLFG